MQKEGGQKIRIQYTIHQHRNSKRLRTIKFSIFNLYIPYSTLSISFPIGTIFDIYISQPALVFELSIYIGTYMRISLQKPLILELIYVCQKIYV